jgi:hypothetical protein
MSDVTAVGGATPPATKTTKTTKATTEKANPKGFKETLEKVSGHKYAKVGNGVRKGEFVNQSGNARDGDAFKLVERDGFEFHVYGDRVVRLPKAAADKAS